jgi:hypothetical protein
VCTGWDPCGRGAYGFSRSLVVLKAMQFSSSSLSRSDRGEHGHRSKTLARLGLIQATGQCIENFFFLEEFVS